MFSSLVGRITFLPLRYLYGEAYISASLWVLIAYCVFYQIHTKSMSKTSLPDLNGGQSTHSFIGLSSPIFYPDAVFARHCKDFATLTGFRNLLTVQFRSKEIHSAN